MITSSFYINECQYLFIIKDPLYRRLLLHITEQAPPEKITQVSGTTEVVLS